MPPPPYSHKGFSKLSFKKKAFTLAEVLITLTIIGVVAAMTIPTLMSKYQKHQYVVALKKTYSQLQNAVKMIPITEGCPSGDYNCAPVTNEALAKQFKVGKPLYNCSLMYHNYTHRCLQLQDGTILGLGVTDNSPNSTMGVDINGEQGPNKWGRDRFFFQITSKYEESDYPQGTVVPFGSKQYNKRWAYYWKNNLCNTSDVSTEFSMSNCACTGRVLEEDAMNY